MSDITGPQFWENIDPENLDEMQSFVLIEHLRAENNMLFDRAAQGLARIKELEAQLASVSRELVSTDNADRYYRGFNDGFDHANAALTAQLQAAQSWVPAHDEDRIIDMPDKPGYVFMLRYGRNGANIEYVTLPDGYQLMRRRTQACPVGEADER